MCTCGHITQSLQHLVVECMTHKAPSGFDGLPRTDAATRYCLEYLNIGI